MYCGKCGTEIQNDASFCPNCGEKTAYENNVPYYENNEQYYNNNNLNYGRKSFLIGKLKRAKTISFLEIIFIPISYIWAFISTIIGFGLLKDYYDTSFLRMIEELFEELSDYSDSIDLSKVILFLLSFFVTAILGILIITLAVKNFNYFSGLLKQIEISFSPTDIDSSTEYIKTSINENREKIKKRLVAIIILTILSSSFSILGILISILSIILHSDIKKLQI